MRKPVSSAKCLAITMLALIGLTNGSVLPVVGWSTTVYEASAPNSYRRLLGRPEFITKVSASLSGPDFVNAVLATISSARGIELTSQSGTLNSLYMQGGCRSLHEIAAHLKYFRTNSHRYQKHPSNRFSE